MSKKKFGELLPYKFDLKDCKASIQLIEGSKDRGYGVAFLNVEFPDGRWISFKSVEGMRVKMYADAKTNHKEETEAKKK